MKLGDFVNIGDTTQASKAIKDMFSAVVGDDELFSLYAQMYWNSYVALKKAGFNHEEAMQIVCSPSFKVTS